MATNRNWPGIARVGIGVQVVALAGLHLLPTGYPASVYFVSEYALSPFRWLMVVSQIGGLVGLVGVLGALLQRGVIQRRSFATRLLGLAILTSVLGTLFRIDPTLGAYASAGTPRFTTSGWIHAISGMVYSIALLVAMGSITRRLRRNTIPGRGGPFTTALAIVAPLAYVAMVVTPPGTSPAGVYQRLFLGAALLWMLLVTGEPAETE